MKAVLLPLLLLPTLTIGAQVELLDAPQCIRLKGTAMTRCRVKVTSDALRDQMKRGLKDPYSAVFSDEGLYSSDDPAAIALCGRLNSKNSFGGYTGVSGFISTTTGLVRLEGDQPSAFGALRELFCSKPVSAPPSK